MAEILMDLPNPESLALNAIRIDSVQVSSTMATIQYSIGHKDGTGAFGAIRTAHIDLCGLDFADFASVIDYEQVAMKLYAAIYQTPTNPEPIIPE